MKVEITIWGSPGDDSEPEKIEMEMDPLFIPRFDEWLVFEVTESKKLHLHIIGRSTIYNDTKCIKVELTAMKSNNP